MKMILLKTDITQNNISDLRLYAPNLSDDEKTALSEQIALPLSDDRVKNDNGIIAILPKDFTDEQSDEYLLLTADDNEDELAEHLDIKKLTNILIYVKDFKDGRVFSLIRQIRQVNTSATIIVSGEFGLDQSSYFVKSGATGFVVDDDKVDTLKHTLSDLKSAYNGQSVRALPIFS